ncbi:MAG TPA: hypothetical protein VGQ09_12615 [Chitinophagaceae bacterium]|jgi:hypothetical protein|nr:hypothetical protein [Chitinophagaceae bacterium]
MKRFILLLTVLVALTLQLSAQDENEQKEKGFKKENLFTGGSITASFFTGGTILGASPMFGYQLANWVDAGILFNYTYQGRRDYIYFDDKLRQHVLGPGVFTRLYPARFLFVQGQFEHNFTNLTYTDPSNFKTKTKDDANSFLVGAGIAEGRQRGSNSFFYLSILFDVLKNPNSPYVNNVYDGNVLVRTDIVPIIRAGVNIGLFQGSGGRYNEERGNGRKRARSYDRY